MRNIKILTIGKVKNQSLKFEIEELKKRISRLEIIELKEVKDKNIKIIKKKEFEIIKPYLNDSNFNSLLTEKGKNYSTIGFYDFIKKRSKMSILLLVELTDLAMI